MKASYSFHVDDVRFCQAFCIIIAEYTLHSVLYSICIYDSISLQYLNPISSGKYFNLKMRCEAMRTLCTVYIITCYQIIL
jgi:hypothetical protein